MCVQKVGAGNEVEPIGGHLARDRCWRLTEAGAQMIDHGVVIDGQLSERDELDRFENDGVRKMKRERATSFIGWERVGPWWRTETARRRWQVGVKVMSRLDENFG